MGTGILARGCGQGSLGCRPHQGHPANTAPKALVLGALSRIPGRIRLSLMARQANSSPKEPASYELALAELDRLVQQMEGGQLPLDQLLDAYRRGAELLTFCRARLQAVEEQVKLLEDGQLKPWDAA